MKPHIMYYIALGTVIDGFKASDMWIEYARIADGQAERDYGNRKSLRFKAQAVVRFDREMDRLVKDYK